MAQVEAGDLPPDLDVDAAHLLGVATAIAVGIYGDAAARQLGVPVEELRSRVRAQFEQMLVALLAPTTTPSAGEH